MGQYKSHVPLIDVNILHFKSSLIKVNHFFLNPFLITLFLVAIFFGCSSSKRFTSDKTEEVYVSSNTIRVLLSEKNDEMQINVDDEIYISDKTRKFAQVRSGNKIIFTSTNENLQLRISDKIFYSDTFYLTGAQEDNIIKFNARKYRGRIKIFSSGFVIKLVNEISLEDYVKGVITKEMPLGKGRENYEALKAFSICVRTYAYNKLSSGRKYFDVFTDVRDQVYGGVDGESEYSNSIVDETRGLLLTFNDEPATIFYSSTCGGFTEDVKNVFSSSGLPYLKSIADGEEPYCSISPRFSWEESYSEEVLLSRLYDAKLISDKNYRIKNVNVNSRFESGRVNELEIILTDKNGKSKSVVLVGNNMRSIIKSSDGKSLLRSTMFNITLQNDNSVIISGKGNGHGVGLCQWGAIGQSKQGINYSVILNHYFPGTKVKKIYD